MRRLARRQSAMPVVVVFDAFCLRLLTFSSLRVSSSLQSGDPPCLLSFRDIFFYEFIFSYNSSAEEVRKRGMCDYVVTYSLC